MISPHDRDAIAVSRALGRGGYVSSADLRDAGFSRGDREIYQRGEVLRRVGPRLFSVVDIGTPDAWHDRVWRAAGACGEGAVVGREAAARLHGLAGGAAGASVVILVPPTSRRRRIAGVDVYRSPVPDSDRVALDGLQLTNPLRTVVDCARFSDRLTAVCLLESAARQGVVSLDEVAARLLEMTRAPHVRRAREALRLVDVRSESPLETAVRLPLLDAGLPYPELQLPFRCGGISGRVDIAYPIELLGGRRGGRYVGLAIEADGREWHVGDEVFHHDRRRQTALEEAGWLVRRFTDRHARRSPAYVVETTRRAIATVLT
ncbi:MAG: hypothetical protein ABIM89_15525 [Mycobacteriales bacterium]